MCAKLKKEAGEINFQYNKVKSFRSLRSLGRAKVRPKGVMYFR